MTLRTRIITIVNILVLIPLLAVAVLIAQRLESANTRENLNAMQRTVEQVEERAQLARQRSVSSIGLLSEHDIIGQFLNTAQLEARYLLHLPQVLALLENYRRVNTEFALIAVLDTEFQIQASRGDEALLQPLLRKGADRRLQIGELSEWVDCGLSDRPCLMVSEPVQRARAAGQIGVGHQITTGYTVIISQPQFLESLKQQYAGGLSGDLLLAKGDGNPWAKDVTRPLLLSQNVALNKQAGISEYTVARQAANNLWVVGTLDTDGGNTRSMVGVNVGAAALWSIVLVVSLLLWVLEHYVFLPLKALKQSAELMAGGDFDSRIPQLRGDEIGALGNTLEHLQQTVISSRARIRELALKDPLTGLQNRSMFSEVLQYTLESSERSGQRHAMMFLDLDNFKQINDSLGHAVGDDLLKQVAQRLRDSLRKTDLITHGAEAHHPIARFGGDEFQVLLTDIRNSEDVSMVANNLLESLREAFHIEHHTVHVSGSIGAAMFPDDGEDAESLFRQADLAMYDAKNNGRDSFRFFANDLNERADLQLKIQQRLRVALDHNTMELQYQPRVCAKNGHLLGAEALLRWNDAELGILSPADFIPIAEARGIIHDITRWVVNNACAELAAWEAAGHRSTSVSVNVSSLDISKRSLPQVLREALQRYQVNPANIVIELTESGLLDSSTHPDRLLGEIRRIGVQIALDDFGTGYSSLAYLQRLPLDDIKIDRSFINELSEDARAAPVVKAIAGLATAIGMTWTAEGVETAEQLSALKALNCDSLQGYLLSRPLDKSSFRELLNLPIKPWEKYWEKSQAKPTLVTPLRPA